MNFFETLRIILKPEHVETIVCKRCGKEYKSTGKKDPGICKDCRMIFNDGPLDGMKAGDLNDKTGS